MDNTSKASRRPPCAARFRGPEKRRKGKAVIRDCLPDLIHHQPKYLPNGATMSVAMVPTSYRPCGSGVGYLPECLTQVNDPKRTRSKSKAQAAALCWPLGMRRRRCMEARLMSLFVRPTKDELRRPLPGDALVSNAAATVTHAATIRAPLECVWPWLVQMGAGRAGWYSYDWVDNGGKPSASEVIPASIYCTGGCHAIASRCRFLQRAR